MTECDSVPIKATQTECPLYFMCRVTTHTLCDNHIKAHSFTLFPCAFQRVHNTQSALRAILMNE